MVYKRGNFAKAHKLGIHKKKGIRNVQKSVSGSYTVEASFLMPIIIFLIMGILSFAQSQYEVCKLQGFMNEAIIRYSNLLSQHYDLEEIKYEAIITENLFDILGPVSNEKKKLFEHYMYKNFPKDTRIVKIQKVNVVATRKDIHMEIIYHTNLMLPMSELIFQGNKVLTAYGRVHRPSDYVRVVSVILKETKKIKYYDELKEQLDQWIEYLR